VANLEESRLQKDEANEEAWIDEEDEGSSAQVVS
jgi:hypothetical protein